MPICSIMAMSEANTMRGCGKDPGKERESQEMPAKENDGRNTPEKVTGSARLCSGPSLRKPA